MKRLNQYAAILVVSIVLVLMDTALTVMIGLLGLTIAIVLMILNVINECNRYADSSDKTTKNVIEVMLFSLLNITVGFFFMHGAYDEFVYKQEMASKVVNMDGLGAVEKFVASREVVNYLRNGIVITIENGISPSSYMRSIPKITWDHTKSYSYNMHVIRLQCMTYAITNEE